MKASLYLSCTLIGWLAFGNAGPWVEPQKQGEVCPDPASACTSSNYSFGEHELSFRVPQRPDAGLGGFASRPFYAVILKSVRAQKAAGSDDCSYVSEGERRKTQSAFPGSKVFASRFQCPEQILLYTNTDQEYNFMAVYAGRTRVEALRTLNRAKAKYPQSNLRRMQVVISVE